MTAIAVEVGPERLAFADEVVPRRPENLRQSAHDERRT
jgi:hypothetical protein